MSGADARQIVMCEVACQGVPALFSELRLERSTIPGKLNVYEVRYADTDVLTPACVERRVYANFRGTLITTRPLNLGRGGRYRLKEPLRFSRANVMPLEEFCARYRVRHKERESHER
jgi:hypothetical protein